MEAPGGLPELMARCLAYLESQGIGPLELATMSLGDTTATAKQPAFEMNIPYGGYLDEAVDTWLQGAREERDLLQRARGVYGSDLEWRLLQSASSSATSTEVLIPKPDPGERPIRMRGPVMESTDREQRLQHIWCNRLREELDGCKAPVLATLESSLDSNRAIAMLAGRKRVTTLKRYVTVFQQWRLWLLEARRSIPELIMKAICWMEKVAEFPVE